MNAEEEYDNDEFVEEAYSEENKEPNARRANGAKNEHLDKEVEKVTRKQSAGVRQKESNAGYALPGDDEADDGPGVGLEVDPDEEDEDEDEDEDEEAGEDEDGEGHMDDDEQDMEGQEDMDDIEQ